jgi:hypothetical protein
MSTEKKMQVSYEVMVCAALAVLMVMTTLAFINAIFSAPMIA